METGLGRDGHSMDYESLINVPFPTFLLEEGWDYHIADGSEQLNVCHQVPIGGGVSEQPVDGPQICLR